MRTTLEAWYVQGLCLFEIGHHGLDPRCAHFRFADCVEIHSSIV